MNLSLVLSEMCLILPKRVTVQFEKDFKTFIWFLFLMGYTFWMNENIPNNEGKIEKIFSEREVLNILDEVIGGDYEITSSVEDEDGLSKMEVRTKDEAGEIVQYDYRRKDNAGETVFDVVFFDGDMPVGGHPVRKYIEGVQSYDKAEALTAGAEFLEKVLQQAEAAGYQVIGNDGKEILLTKTISETKYICTMKYAGAWDEPGYEIGGQIEIGVFMGNGVDNSNPELEAQVFSPVLPDDEAESEIILKELQGLLDSSK